MGLVSTTVALLVGLLGIAIDVITTHVGLLNATEDRTPEGDLTLLDHLGTWSPAAFFVLGYVLISFGAGAFKQWRLAQYELDSKEYASYLHEKQRRDLIASKGAAYKRQDTADGIKETAPRHIEVGELPQLRKLTVACNRVVTLRWEVKAISERIQVEQKSYEARTQAFNVLRQEPREQLSEAHRKLVEETAHTAHIEGMRFRWVLFQVVRDAELSPFFRWLRSWVWLFEPLWTRWRRFR